MNQIKTLEEISSFLIYNEDYDTIKQIENTLTIFLHKEIDILRKENIYFLLIIAKIRNSILAEEIDNSIIDYVKQIKIFSSKIKSEKQMVSFYKNIVFHLIFIKKKYTDKFYWWYVEELLYTTRQETKKELYLLEKNYAKYIRRLLYKYLLGYGRSYFNLMYTSMVTWFIFAFLYFLTDAYWYPWTLYSNTLWVSEKLVGGFDYYLYLSINTLSNLWADFSLWSNLFLRVLFWIEQLAGVILTGLFLYVLAKKI